MHDRATRAALLPGRALYTDEAPSGDATAGAAVCIVRQAYYPDGHVRRDAETLARAGWDVSVVSLRRPGQAAREVLNGVAVHRLPITHQRGGVLRYVWEYAAFLVLAFLTVTMLHIRKRFRVVEVDNMPDVLVFAALVPKLTGARIIFYIFDNMPEIMAVARRLSASHPAVRLLAFFERVATAFADEVIVTQDTARQIVEARGTAADKITVILNCPDEEIFPLQQLSEATPISERDARAAPAAMPAAVESEGAFTVLTHGTILERWGNQTLIEALPLVARAIPGVRARIFGEGEFRPALEELARRHGVAERVEFGGWIPPEQLPAEIKKADVGYVGVTFGIALSNKLMEYAALGLPVVITRWPSHEAYFDDQSVTYFRSEDPQDLARAILAIHHDAARARGRAVRAATLYAGYRWSVQRETYLRLHRRMLSRTAGRRDTHMTATAIERDSYAA